jgi:hypothetical protein
MYTWYVPETIMSTCTTWMWNHVYMVQNLWTRWHDVSCSCYYTCICRSPCSMFPWYVLCTRILVVQVHVYMILYHQDPCTWYISCPYTFTTTASLWELLVLLLDAHSKSVCRVSIHHSCIHCDQAAKRSSQKVGALLFSAQIWDIVVPHGWSTPLLTTLAWK